MYPLDRGCNYSLTGRCGQVYLAEGRTGLAKEAVRFCNSVQKAVSSLAE